MEQLRAHGATIEPVGQTESAHRSEGILVEVAIDSVAGARAATRAGAGRLELCCALGEGGLTPSVGLLEAVAAATDLPVFVMLRPRSGDFVFDADERNVVHRDLRHLAAAGAAGFVFGALRPDGHLDGEALAAVVSAAAPLPVTCHRAFDLCLDPFAALGELAALGVRRLLSSGQAASAPDGTEMLRMLVAAAEPGFTVMAGAGVRAANVAALVNRTGVREVHLSATAWNDGPMQFRRGGVPMGSSQPPDEYRRRITSEPEVAAVVAAVAAATLDPTAGRPDAG